MFFEKQVDTRSRKSMVEFLTGHFRYPTNNSWARTSYANRVKILYLGLTRHQENRAYDVLGTNYWRKLQVVIDDFTLEMNGEYTIVVNGRLGGYLVLLRGEYYDTEDKSRSPIRQHRALGFDIDQYLKFEDWSMSELRERVELVRRFDRACDDIRSAFIDILDNCEVVEETVMVPTTVRRIACVGAGC